MKLYDYYRSTACYRVRIALNLKGIDYEKVSVHLINDGGQQHSPEYHQINPQELVPSLEIEGHIFTQSLTIIDYLEETYPEPALLPKKAIDRATVRSLAQIIACDMHPLNNLRILNYLKSEFKADEPQVMKWYYHWLKTGFDAFEAKLHSIKRSGPFCFGSTPSIADLCLIPQLFNAQRVNFATDKYPLIQEINAHCLLIKSFQEAAPLELKNPF